MPLPGGMTTTARNDATAPELTAGAALDRVTGISLLDSAGQGSDLCPQAAQLAEDRVEQHQGAVLGKGRAGGGTAGGRVFAVQDGGQVLGVPAEGEGEGFEGSRVAAPLDPVLLDLADDGQRHPGPLGQVLLPQIQLGCAGGDG